MAHESFENPEIAALMNEHFVNIKVDREERPDLDAIYQNALHLMGEHGGWPLTMFLTPDGEPFWGGTYFPPEPRWGRPELSAGADARSRAAYRDKREDVAKNVAALREGLQQARRSPRAAARRLIGIRPNCSTASPSGCCARSIRSTAASAPRRNSRNPAFSNCCGGPGSARGKPPYSDAVTRTLTTIGQGGIYDHLGGGWARYSTDARWLVPHFEKMLYDNAELVGLMSLVWQETRDPLYATAGRRDGRLARARDDPSARAGSTAASTPTASTRRANSTSGPRPRSTRCSEASAPRCSSASTT